MVSAQDIIPTRRKDGYCLTCNKKLSSFNLNDYCFLHNIDKVRKEDKEQVEMEQAQARKYRVKRK